MYAKFRIYYTGLNPWAVVKQKGTRRIAQSLVPQFVGNQTAKLFDDVNLLFVVAAT